MEKYQIFDFGLLHLEWSNAVFVLYVFLVVMIGLNFWLFRPILQTLEIRRQITKKQKTNQQIAEKACQDLELEYDTKLNKAEQAIQRLLETKKLEQQEQTKQALKSAQEELASMFEQQKQTMEQWFAEEQKRVPVLAKDLADQLYQKLYDSKA